LLASRRK